MSKPRIYHQNEAAFWKRLEQKPPYIWVWSMANNGKPEGVKILNPRFDIGQMAVVGHVVVEPRWTARISNYA